MKSTVIVPTYRRPQDLARCLKALTQQVNLPAEVIAIAVALFNAAVIYGIAVLLSWLISALGAKSLVK